MAVNSMLQSNTMDVTGWLYNSEINNRHDECRGIAILAFLKLEKFLLMIPSDIIIAMTLQDHG